MATKKKALSPATQSKSLANIDAELANEVANIKNTIGQPGGNRLKVEVKGSFTSPEGLDLGDELQVVVLDYTSRNNFYSTPWDPNNPAPPDCYAIGKVIADMAPEDDSPQKQNDDCRTCPLNAFGSGQGGSGKACQNRRLVAVLVVDPENPDAHNEPDAPIYMLDLSPSNNKSFDGAVSAVARALNGPPIKAILTVTAENAGTYAKVFWSAPVPNPDYATHAARRSECIDMLNRKPDFSAPPAKPSARKGAAPRRAAGGRR